jgi:hypothetical protein
MRDVRIKIYDEGDPELNFLNRDFLRNNLQFSVFNLQLFSVNKTQPTQFIGIISEEIKSYSKKSDQILKMEQIQKNFLKCELLRRNLRFLVSNLQVFFKMAPCVRRLSSSGAPPGGDTTAKLTSMTLFRLNPGTETVPIGTEWSENERTILIAFR